MKLSNNLREQGRWEAETQQLMNGNVSAVVSS